MLLQFSVSNYRCFRDRVTLNMAASSQDKSLPGNVIERKLPGIAGGRWLKGVVLYGANASGKSTVVQAIGALSALVRTSAKLTDRKEPIEQIEPFALCPGQEQVPTAFSIAFVAGDVRYEYRVAATRERIWHESLRAAPKAKEQLWFSRDYDPQADRYHFSPERPSGFRRDPQLEGYTLPNVLFLSKAIANNRTDLEPVFNWLTQDLAIFDMSTANPLGMSFNPTLMGLQDASLGAQIRKLLRHADLGVTDAQAVEWTPARSSHLSDEYEKGLQQRHFQNFELFKQGLKIPELTHRGSGSDVPLPWDRESAGTRRFFSLLGPWLGFLDARTTFCLDELDTSLHPLMVRELLRLYFSSDTNQEGAQLLFTTHNPLLLDTALLRRDQIWLTDKDDAGAAHLYPLSDYQPRKGESLTRGYLSGRYGAVPFLPEGVFASAVAPAAAPSKSPGKKARRG